ncbi:hypothetical protein X793_03730 [Dehalococcoides mccartyi CG4]|nr:hypothetical protein X793_03730 [Dehalococcoides mccartyi CG4]
MGELSKSEKEEIFKRIRSLAITHINAGVSTGSLVLCHNCGYAKPLIGSTRYGKFRLCNDCALRYELMKAEGRMKNIEDFVLD